MFCFFGVFLAGDFLGFFFHREIKGRFRKRVVLANVPSFRFSFRGNMRTYPCSGFVPGKHPNVPSFRFSFRGNIRQKHPFGNHPFRFLRFLEGFLFSKVLGVRQVRRSLAISRFSLVFFNKTKEKKDRAIAAIPPRMRHLVTDNLACDAPVELGQYHRPLNGPF